MGKDVEDCEKKVADGRPKIDEMNTEAEGYFAAWKASAEAIADPDLRKRSEDRLADARARFDKIAAAGKDTRQGFDALMTDVKDQYTFLGHDLNAGAIATLKPNAAKFNARADHGLRQDRRRDQDVRGVHRLDEALAGAREADGERSRMKTGAWTPPRRFWESDRGLSAFLGILVVFLFVLPPLVGPKERGRGLVIDLGFTALLLAGVAALSTRPAVRAALFALVVGATAVRWGPFSVQATAVAGLVSAAAMTLVVLAQAFRAGPVNVHRIQGAVAAYLLLGLVWALAYELVALGAAGAFSGAGLGGAGRPDLIYFSFVTLTTVGYGDVTPVDPVARSLAVAEALTGQLYPAILLARLVSLVTGSRPS